MNASAQAPSVHTICPYCGVGCGVVATPDDAGGAAIEGDKSHPANFGRLCSKGTALGETLGLETRLLHPMVDGARATWNAALDRVAGGLRRTIERHGPDAVAFYLSGQLLTEDYYAANKLMKGFIGSANVDTNSRLCMASSVAGHKRAFGSDTVPGCYEDLDEADLLVLVGSNAAWCHPVLYRRMVRARRKRSARIVTIDVRSTATTDSADLALTIAPGMDSVLSDTDYDALAPLQWPVSAGAPGGKKRMFADGRFFTPSGRARFIAIEEPVLAEAPDADFPFLLNTGRVRDQWHTMTRTGLSPRLASHMPDPFVEVNPDDARKLGLAGDGFAWVWTANGSAVLRVNITAAQVPGRIFAPIHWNDETAGRARVGALVHPFTDPYSGQPDSKAIPADLAPVCFAAHGFVLARRRVPLPSGTAYAWNAIEGGYAARFATNEPFAAMFEALARGSRYAERTSYNDPVTGIFRAALILRGRLDAVLFFGREGEVPPWSCLDEAWRLERLDDDARRFLLAGRGASADFDASPTICACFGVKSRAILAAIADGACSTEAVGARLNAGTNCGSCLPELRRMISARTQDKINADLPI